jgi:ubiquinone/menaquinone biosynthesis C-methylase UbiE
MKNINSKEYWDQRFMSGDWSIKGGNNQTKQFALGQIKHLPIDSSFDGVILDFGCAEGDAFSVYREFFPKAKFIGVDLSQNAIETAKGKYGNFVDFYQGDDLFLKESGLRVDVLICSNVFEHLSNYEDILRNLLHISKKVIIVTPYNEYLDPRDVANEHVNTFTLSSFKDFKHRHIIFLCQGWSEFGFNLFFHVFFKNIFRFLLGKKTRNRSKKIMYIIEK